MNTAPPTPVAPKNSGNPKGTTSSRNTQKEPKDEPEPKKTNTPAPKDEGGDDFDKAFGGSSSKTAPKEEKTADTTKKQPGYIPPAPGTGGDVKDSLGTADIIEIVSAKKSDLAACTAKKEAGTSGKIVMEWTIATSGKVTKVGVGAGSEDYKGTPMATCFATVIKGMVFPKHKQQGDPVKFPFKF